jgi:hypothetical protein
MAMKNKNSGQWPLENMHGLVSRAVSSLLLHGDPEDIANGFLTLSHVGSDDQSALVREQARRWWETVQRLMGPSGEPFIRRAERLTRDDKLELSNALWELHCHLDSERWRFYGVE